MDDRLRSLWDFDDLDTSEKRLREQLEHETGGAGKAEVLTQLARVEGLRDRFEEGERLIEEAEALAGDDRTAKARIDLERGRLRRSGGDPDAARPLFVSAFDVASDAGQTFIAADAAHMAALVAGGRDGFIEWTRRGIDLAERDQGASYWLGPLYNNLGWEYYEAGDYEQALDAFERQVVARERDADNRQALEIARYSVGKALRAVGRSAEAVRMLEGCVAWADGEGAPDGWFHEELAEEYAAVGRDTEAADQARAAIPLLERDDPDFASDETRSARLRALADSKS
jgi:tetratricopeptide (TPR) repeat protein